MELKNKLAILTVIYNKTREQVNYTTHCLKGMPKDIHKLGIINHSIDDSVTNYLDNYMVNDENCLSKAWNMGLQQLFKKYEYILVVGTDQEVRRYEIEDLYEFALANKQAGLWSARPSNIPERQDSAIKHGDGSFSYFLIHKDTFEKVGKFDENFIPAYFEDSDYLERLWFSGYEPMQAQHVEYLHIQQGTVRYSEEDAKAYPEYMQKNLDYYKQKWGKVPDHLDKDIKFSEQ